MDKMKLIDSTNTANATINSSQTSAAAKSANAGQMEKTDFLNILVQQLKNQDPLEPMKNDQFAVNLAQFSQLEQLISINTNLSSGGGAVGDVSSLAGYLGHEVLLQEETVSIAGGSEDSLSVKLPKDASGLVLELTRSGGEGAPQRIALPGAEAGSHTIRLSDLGIAAGEYQFAVKGVGVSGSEFDAEALVVGTVSGFVPGPEPKLVVGDREVDPTAVRQVRLPAG